MPFDYKKEYKEFFYAEEQAIHRDRAANELHCGVWKGQPKCGGRGVDEIKKYKCVF